MNIFESDDLTPDEHTLTLTATGTIGIDGAYVIDNGGLGMIGIENAEYVMNEDETINVKLIRTGGSTGTATVLLSPDPGTAIQDDYDTECITEVVFAEGETEKTAPVRTRRNTNATGEQYFIVGLTTETENLILGFNSKAKVRINDSEALTVEDLEALGITEDMLKDPDTIKERFDDDLDKETLNNNATLGYTYYIAENYLDGNTYFTFSLLITSSADL